MDQRELADNNAEQQHLAPASGQPPQIRRAHPAGTPGAPVAAEGAPRTRPPSLVPPPDTSLAQQDTLIVPRPAQRVPGQTRAPNMPPAAPVRPMSVPTPQLPADLSAADTLPNLAVPAPSRAGSAARRRAGQWRTTLQTHRVELLLMALLIVLSCGSLGIGGFINAATQLREDHSLAQDGLSHLEHLRTLVNPSQLDRALNTTTLTEAQRDLSAAEGDFGALRSTLASPQGTFALASHLPWAGGTLASAANLAAAADEACLAGLAFVQDGQLALQVMQGGFFAGGSATKTTSSSSTPPTLDMATYNRLRAGLTGALQHLQAAVGFAERADLSALPSSLVKPTQVAEIRQLLAKWPQIQTTIGKLNAVLDILPGVLGLQGSRQYLVELMDSTELRAGGGFIGNYTIMTVANGKIQPFTLSDTYLLDRPYLASHGGTALAPSQYPWWPFNTVYGLRDSNLSGNFPTSAQLGMQQLAREGGPAVRGVIAITPAAVEGVIHIIGPIAMPQYGQVVTASNLEHLIHLYQQVPSEQPLAPLPPSEQISSPSKRFTALLGQAFVQKLHGLSLASQIAIGKQLLASVHAKDIQMYFSDAKAEALLTQYQIDGAFPRPPDDGVSLVDANVSVSKGSQFLTVTLSDHVTLDNQGTATHDLTITYRFDVTNAAELYGPDYYRTYLRVYTPAGAQLRSLQGFTNLYGDDQIGHSDQPGYQMWGGYLIIQDGTPYTLHISWRVPHAASRAANGRYTYALEYTRQAGLQQVLNTTISVPGSSRTAYQSAGHLNGDKYINITYGG